MFELEIMVTGYILGLANRFGSAHDILRMNSRYFANGF